MKKNFLISLLISAPLIYLSSRGVDFDNVFKLLQSPAYEYLALAVLFLIAIGVCRTYRLQLIFSSIERISFKKVFQYNAVGFMFIFLLPMRLGEFIIPLLIKKNSTISFSAALSSIFIERIVDLIVLVSILFFVISQILMPEWLTRSGYFIGVFVFVALFFFFITYHNSALAWKIIKAMIKFLPQVFVNKIENTLRELKKGFAVIKHPRYLIQIVAISFFVWALSAGVIFAMFKFLNMQAEFLTALTVMVINTIGISLPAGPGMIGNFQYSCIMALSIFSFPKAQAFLFANIYHVLLFSQTVLTGLIFLPFINFKLADLKESFSLKKEHAN